VADVLGQLGIGGVIRERLRQERAFDQDFLTAPTYYFELRVPPETNTAGATSFVFPLVLAPDQISVTEPFTLSETETQGAGLYIERNGIIRRTIRLRGTTGFKPRPYRGDTFPAIQASDIKKGYNRGVLDRSLNNAAGLLAFSGQRHFQFLQDAVFRTYSDLLQTPRYATRTFLVWHNPKDDEHWLVEPRNFKNERDRSSRTTYPYDIELLAYAPADDIGRVFSEDKNVIDTIKDGLRMVNSAVRTARGAIQDVTNLVNTLDKLVNGIATTINNATSVLDDAADFVNGSAEFIASPFDAVTSVTTNLAAGLEALGDATVSVPDTIFQSLRQVQDSFDRLGQFPEFFRTDSQTSLRRAQRNSELSTSKSRATLEAAAARTPPNSFQGLLALGTANLPGDLQKAEGELGIGRELVSYQSAVEYRVASGDTLQNLASRFLGDARRWRAIAVLNRLKPPYISTSGIPGTATIGSEILIPSTNPPPVQRTLTPVLGVDPEESGAERLLGADAKLTRVAGTDTFDIEIDVEGGSEDIKLASGVDNLKQGILSRLRTEKGTNQLYREVGVDRIIATQDAALNRDIVLFRIAQAVRADPRVVAVQNLRSRSELDKVEIEFDVQPINYSGSIPVGFEV
jgi:hypothetical protein